MKKIRPELLAAKLQRIRNLEAPRLAASILQKPRLVEVLWTIEAMFRQPGGAAAFAARLTELLPKRFMGAEMQGMGWTPENPVCSVAQCLPIWKDHMNAGTRSGKAIGPDEIRQRDWSNPDYGDWLDEFIFDSVTEEELREIKGQRKQWFTVGWKKFNVGYFIEKNQWRARGRLPQLLLDWCEDPECDFSGVYYCTDIYGTILEFIDHHAAKVSQSLAQTEITKIVFNELDFALSQKVPVPIIGDSRFGKTKSVFTWCEMRPGVARLISVPESNREWDFYAAHADAFGIEYDDTTSAARLKRAVEFVSRQSGLFLVYDEAHFLIPTNYTQTTPPKRINWVRCQIIDRELGCAFFATPQDYRQTMAQYVKKTGQNMDQWIGRMAPAVLLPAELTEEDLLSVAKIHFPELNEDLLGIIAARAMTHEGYLKSMEIAAKRARFIAEKAGRKEVTVEDVDAALEQVLPRKDAAQAQPAPATKTRPATPTQPRGRTSAPPPRETQPTAYIGRQIRPLEQEIDDA